MKRACACLMLAAVVIAPSACGDAQDTAVTTGPEGATTDAAATALPTKGLIEPGDLEYVGAFRLPEEGDGWTYGGTAMAYRPDGDPGGEDDGFPGSLFATGNDQRMEVAEVSIPVPVVSTDRDPEALNRAMMLQPFTDVMGRFGVAELELPRTGLAYLPPTGEQEEGKLYFCWGEHMSDEYSESHGWTVTDLGSGETAGGWHVEGQSSFSTSDYMFAIPQEWADTHVDGRRLATGRYRDGGWSGQGPSLFALAPWAEGDPSPGTGLEATPLLLYTASDDFSGDSFTMDGYHHSDEWSGAAWMTSGDRAAVVFAGTKGQGHVWYGFANGVVWPDEPPYPEVPPAPYDDRGWWSDSFTGRLIFYDPADLAAVASGAMEPWEPQPYAALDLDDYLFAVESEQQKGHVGAIDFDAANGLLYVIEPLADGEQGLVHVWRVA